MGRVGKRFKKAKSLVEVKPYKLEDAMPLIKKMATAKFDETVEVAMRLVDDELSAAMRQTGVARLADISKASLQHLA